ncbi:MAG: energy-coupling factor transporter transmembrane component T [Bacilli bacterium]|nr:energy-coupling factor transporter transmembrane component T [Bacilli bacterium]
MTSVTFGRYAPYNTFIHRLDPRNKIILMVLLMVTIFLPFSVWSTSLIMSSIYLMILVIVMLIAKVSFINLFKSLKAMWFLILFLLIVYIFIPNPTYTHVAFSIKSFDVYWDAFYQSAYIVLRLILMICITTILTSTTKPLDLTYALEWYLVPLKVIKFPTHEVAMTISIALRFIPTILDETDRIMKAQTSRGAEFNHGRLFKRFKAIISLIVPLFISAFERSGQLAEAMEARGYDPRAKRTRYRTLKFHWTDAVSFLLIGAIFAGVLYLTIAHKDMNLITEIFKVEVSF